MGWTTPKTDWHGSTDASGVYTGDRFDASDYNRIKNNILVLYDFAMEQYKAFDIEDMGSDKTYSDYLYADEINAIEKSFKAINEGTVKGSYGDMPTYYDNGSTMDYTELNRLESAILDIYNKLSIVKTSKRRFTWQFGMGQEDF